MISHSYSYRGIDKTPGVCGGDACIRHTRIPVWALVQLRQLGTDEADLLRTYPTLTADDLVNAWSYISRTQQRSLSRSPITSQLKGTTVSKDEQWLQTPEYQAAYQELELEIELVRLLIETRIKADFTQVQSERTA